MGDPQKTLNDRCSIFFFTKRTSTTRLQECMPTAASTIRFKTICRGGCRLVIEGDGKYIESQKLLHVPCLEVWYR